MSGSRALTAEKRPADCWDWISPDDVIRHALAAYYAACRSVAASDGPWLDQGTPWSNRACLRDELHGFFRQRINGHALELGITASSGSEMPELPFSLAPDLNPSDQPAVPVTEWRVPDERLGGDTSAGAAPESGSGPGCRGGTPAVEGHGCPALDPAVGPALSACQTALHNVPADPLFIAFDAKNLQVQIQPDNNPTIRGLDNV